MWARSNRRRPPPRWPRLPAVHVDWLAWAFPVTVVLLLGVFLLAGRAALDYPVRSLRVAGEFQRVTPIQIEAALADELDKGLLSVDLKRVRTRIEGLDWVSRAVVGRRWPDTLVVEISEHTAAARWGERGLLNVEGELFAEAPKDRFPELPRLAGPVGSEKTVASYYLSLRGRLIESQLALDRLQMDERGSLRFTLVSGQEIRIGRDDIDARLDRFFDVAAPLLRADFERVAYVDLRYTNGFAVGWREPPLPDLKLSMESKNLG
jgi:cell division protein FtsQ